MNNWYNVCKMKIKAQLSEDVNAPELRNPNNGAMRGGEGWLARLLKGKKD